MSIDIISVLQQYHQVLACIKAAETEILEAFKCVRKVFIAGGCLFAYAHSDSVTNPRYLQARQPCRVQYMHLALR